MREAFQRGWRDAYKIERTRSRFGFYTSMHMSLRLTDREQAAYQKTRSETIVTMLGLWSGSAWQTLRYLGRVYFPKPITEITVILPEDKNTRK